MNPHATEPRPAYELRVPSGGLGARDPRFVMMMWGLGSIALGLVTSYLLVQGMFRPLLLLLLAVLGFACLAPRRAVYILMVFLPFMYFIRRIVLVFQEFSERDPVLIFPAITTVVVCLGVLIFYSPRVFHYFRKSTIMKASALLIGILFLQIFNPLQGSLLVGLAGGMYFIVPMLWILLGLMMTREDIEKVFKIVFVIGCGTAFYGIYQHYFGLSSFEIYELQAKHFLKTFGSISETRVMSTFSGLVDFARYLTMSGFLAFAYYWRRKRAISYLFLLGVQLWAMLFTASRTSFLVTFFSIIMLTILSGSSMRQVLVRGAMACALVLVLYSIVYQYDPQRAYGQDLSSNPFVVHTLSGVTHPTREVTFQGRIEGWARVVWRTPFDYPMGMGLGSTTTAASKFEGGEFREMDSYFFELFYGSGLVPPVLFIIIAYALVRTQLKLCLDFPDEYLFRIAFGLMCGMLLSSVFGMTARDNITGPFMWLLVGWVIREQVDRSSERPTPAPAAARDAAR